MGHTRGSFGSVYIASLLGGMAGGGGGTARFPWLVASLSSALVYLSGRANGSQVSGAGQFVQTSTRAMTYHHSTTLNANTSTMMNDVA